MFMVVMAVVFADSWHRGQPAIQISGHRFFHQHRWSSGAEGHDALRCKYGRHPPPAAAGDHDFRTLFTRPTWEKSGCVRRWNHRALIEHFSLSGIRLNKNKFPVAAEMFVEPAIDRWKSNRHAYIVKHFELRIKSISTIILMTRATEFWRCVFRQVL